MNRRLQQFLELEKMTAAQLASRLNIQRSGISHILSGRNKPGADFIQKFLTTFNHISSDWFVLGIGRPYREKNSADDVENRENRDTYIETNVNQPISTDDYMFDIQDINTQNNNSQPSENHVNFVNNAPVHKNKSIKGVIILYSDGTYSQI